MKVAQVQGRLLPLLAGENLGVHLSTNKYFKRKKLFLVPKKKGGGGEGIEWITISTRVGKCFLRYKEAPSTMT